WTGEADLIPAEALSLVRAHRRTTPLSEVARLVTQRRRVELRDSAGVAMAEIDDDVVSVLDGSRLAGRFREIEVELAAGSSDDILAPVVRRLRDAGAWRGEGGPKLEQALGARVPRDDASQAVPLGRASSLWTVATATITDGYLRLIERDAGVRLDEDPEDVHRARVATRRLRSDLRTLKPLLDPTWVDDVRPELAWLAGALGGVRDADVLADRLRRQSVALGGEDARRAGVLVTRLLGERARARKDLVEVLESDRYVALLDCLEAAGTSPPVSDDRIARSAGRALTSSDPARRVLAALVSRAWRHLDQVVADLDPEPTDAALHQVRVRSKRLRYACEAARPVIGKRAARMGRAVAAVQEVLGDLNDTAVARAWLRVAAGDADAEVAFSAGMIAAMETSEAARFRAGWPGAWKRLDRKKLRSWLG
ncbi:MAG: CHAD domain-containing protein, partial [Acidimicrobiales bacterium]